MNPPNNSNNDPNDPKDKDRFNLSDLNAMVVDEDGYASLWREGDTLEVQQFGKWIHLRTITSREMAQAITESATQTQSLLAPHGMFIPRWRITRATPPPPPSLGDPNPKPGRKVVWPLNW